MGKIEEVPVFITENFIDDNETYLIHGVEIFRKIYGDDRRIDAIHESRKLQKEFYTLEHVAKTLEAL